jgi:class 3 adenylate cyclase
MRKSNEYIDELFDSVKSEYSNKVEVIEKDNIPNYNYLEVDKWHKVKNVVCVYIDLSSSTQININQHPNTSAKIFKSYVNSFVKVFDEYEAKYIDIQGDGGFALFDGDNAKEKAIVSAVTIKTLISKKDYLSDYIESKTNNKVNLRVRIGIDIGTILVKKLGKRNKSNTDYLNNEVWLGKPVSISSKLCNLKDSSKGLNSDTIRLSDRLYNEIDNNHILYSCDCGNIEKLWTEINFDSKFFGLEKTYILKTNWCNNCGDIYSENILNKKHRVII